VEFPQTRTILRLAADALALAALLAALSSPAPLRAQAAEPAAPPPSTGGFFPLSDVHAGLTGTAWTVFAGSKPEAMQVEILGVLRGARGPGQDMILVRLHGAHPEYTGVVEGMSGSPVYIGNKLLGALAFRIGQFSKEPIAGITPIADMLKVCAPLSASPQATAFSQPAAALPTQQMNFQMMETPLVMSGFHPEAIRLWQQQMASTTLSQIAAGGSSGTSESNPSISSAALATIVPGSAVSAQLVRGDLEISATCTVTYIDPKQLLACGHPVLQAGPVSLPMTTADVVATLASPLNAFKIVNTGATIGAFTDDGQSAIRGVPGAQARMIPMHVSVDSPAGKRQVNVEIVDLPSLTTQAMEVVLYNSLLQANDSTASTSYHLTGSILVAGHAPSPIDLWAGPSDVMPAPMQAAVLAGSRFNDLYANSDRQTALRSIDIHVDAIPRRAQVELVSARLVSSDTAHAGDTVLVEATIQPWQQPARNLRISVALPTRLDPGNLRLLVSDAATLDRALDRNLDQPRLPGHQPDLDAVLAQNRRLHSADHIYVSLLVPETQAGVSGHTLTSLPLSVANALEPMRSAQQAGLNGESALVAADVPSGGILYGFQVITLHIQPGGGLN
jgi:hypothetical protein